MSEVTEVTETSTESEGPIGAVAGQFGLNGQIFLAQLINFLIVLVVLWRFVYRPVVRFLDARAEKIEKSVKQAEEIEIRIKEIEAERANVIAEARKESAQILEKAHHEAETRGEEIVSAAKREVERVISKGKQTLANDQEAMMRELRKEVIDLAMKAATRIVQNEIDEKKSKSIAEEVVRKLS
jgi:F-type H+-transporting ATPase subunit b